MFYRPVKVTKFHRDSVKNERARTKKSRGGGVSLFRINTDRLILISTVETFNFCVIHFFPLFWISLLDILTGYPYWISLLDIPTGYPYWISTN